MISYEDKLKLYDRLQERLIEYRHNEWHEGEYGQQFYYLDGVFEILQEEFGF